MDGMGSILMSSGLFFFHHPPSQRTVCHGTGRPTNKGGFVDEDGPSVCVPRAGFSQKRFPTYMCHMKKRHGWLFDSDNNEPLI